MVDGLASYKKHPSGVSKEYQTNYGIVFENGDEPDKQLFFELIETRKDCDKGEFCKWSKPSHQSVVLRLKSMEVPGLQFIDTGHGKVKLRSDDLVVDYCEKMMCYKIVGDCLVLHCGVG